MRLIITYIFCELTNVINCQISLQCVIILRLLALFTQQEIIIPTINTPITLHTTLIIINLMLIVLILINSPLSRSKPFFPFQ